MRFSIFIVLILSIIGCKNSNQASKIEDDKLSALQIKHTLDKKNRWLVSNQFDSLATIVHPQVVYGHSNCWVQSAEDLLTVKPSDSLAYISIMIDDLEINPIGQTGIVSGVGHFVGIYKLDTFDLHLCFVETYSKVDDQWQLVARQAAKVPQD